MSGVANPASDVIIVMGDDPDGSGGGYHRPQRKRVRTTKVLEMEQQNGDMEWQEEGETSEGALRQNRARKQAAPKSAGGMVEAVQSLKQLLEQDLNKKIEAMKAEFQLEFTKLSDRMAQEVARATAQMAQELSQVRDQLTQVCGELEQTRLQLDMLNKTETPRSSVQSYADAARMTSTSMSSQSSSVARSATPEPVFCTVDTSRVPEDHLGDVTPTMIRKTVEQEMRQSSDQPRWRCVANEEEIQKIKTILETKKTPGARVLRDQLYPIKVDSMNRMAVFDQEFNILPGAIETLNQENEVQIAKVAWLSRKVNPKSYGSMVVYLTKSSDAKRLLQEHYFLVAGESAYTSVFEQTTGPEQCYNCQELGHKAFSCSKTRVCARCATIGHHHSECQAQIPKCVLCSGPHESFSRNCLKRHPRRHE
ncbi:reverse transcriptase [Fusarium oxysporum f. sp. phaseoli]